MTKSELYILIADKNSNVSELLRRQFSDEGYRVGTARDCNQIITMIIGQDRPDLIIVDPDISCQESRSVIALLSGEAKGIPVVFHAFEPDSLADLGQSFSVVEKGPDTDRLKKTVESIFRYNYPDRFL